MFDLMNRINAVFNDPKRITAIGGSYYYTDELLAVFEDDDLLYYVGVMVIDTSCCGTGGCAYAMVAGFVREWQCGTDDQGRPGFPGPAGEANGAAGTDFAFYPEKAYGSAGHVCGIKQLIII